MAIQRVLQRPNSAQCTADDKMKEKEVLDMAYHTPRSRWHRANGFLANSGRSSIHQLRMNFLYFVKLIGEWKSAYDHVLDWIKKGISSRSNRRGTSRRALVTDRAHFDGSNHKLWSCGHSNSFHAQAIADCLEFIKISALAGEEAVMISAKHGVMV